MPRFGFLKDRSRLADDRLRVEFSYVEKDSVCIRGLDEKNIRGTDPTASLYDTTTQDISRWIGV